MQYRALGASGIEASVVGLGTWAIGGWMWGGTDEKESIKAIHAAIDAGVNLIDTAPVYGFGVSEELVGKAIKDRRDKVVVATKCGLVWHTEGGDHFFDSDANHPGKGDAYKVYRYLGPESIRCEIEQSLKRLGTDVIELYQTHWQETKTPREDTMAELLKLKDEGKILAIGVSNIAANELDEYRALGVVDSDQERFSMLDGKAEPTLLPYCHENNIAFLAYSPLEQGLLTGKIGPDRTFNDGDQRKGNPKFGPENLRKIDAMLKKFQPIADAHDVSLAQLAIAWTVSQKGCTHALVGARSPQQAIENAKGGDVDLSADELATMNAAISESYPCDSA